MGVHTAATGSDASRRIALWSARVESYLSSHAFELLFLAIYLVANVLQFVWGAHDEFHHIRDKYEPHHPTHTQFKWYIAIARGAGYTLNLNCALIILLAARLFVTSIRESPLQRVLPLDKSFPRAHIIVAYAIVLGVVIHVPFHFAWLVTFNAWDGLRLWSYTMSVGVGVALMLVFAVMFVTALPYFRRSRFRLFYVTHLVGAALFFPLLILHGMYRRTPETYKWVLAPLLVYLIDRVVRRLKISSASVELTAGDGALRSGNVLELRVPKPFSYRAGQYAEVAVPELGAEWHPFTIASAPHEATMAFYIKAGGDWTDRLRAAFQERVDDETLPPLAVRVRGPFGAPAQHSDAYRRVVLISGGIGATPFAAIAKHLHFRSTTDPHFQHNNKHRKEGAAGKKPAVFSAAEERITAALAQLYTLGGAGVAPQSAAVKAAAGAHAATALNLSATAPVETAATGAPAKEALPVTAPARAAEPPSMDYSLFSDSSDMDESLRSVRKLPALHSALPMAPPPAPHAAEHLAVVTGRRSRTLSFLHSTRVVLLLLMTVLARAALVAIVSIFDIGKFGWTLSSMSVNALWAVRTETILSAFLTAVMVATIALEMSFMGSRFFARGARCADAFVFIPLSLLATLLSGLSWARREARGALTVLHFAVLLPLLFALLAHRLYRSIGSRSLLDAAGPRCKCAEAAPDVDFVWTTPKSADDEWLLDELAPLEGGNALRLHRYVTREKAADLEADAGFIDTQAGRPKWDALFADVAGRAPSGADVGVFFCGPPAMGKAIRTAMRTAEVQSNLRGAYLARFPDWQLGRELGLSTQAQVEKVRSSGSNVRFVFREENF